MTAAAPAAGSRSSAASCRRPANSATAPGIPSSNAATGLAPPHSAPNTAASKAARRSRQPSGRHQRDCDQAARQADRERDPPLDDIRHLGDCGGQPADHWVCRTTRPSSRVVNQVPTTAAIGAGQLGPDVRHENRGPQRVAINDRAAEPPEVDDRQRVSAGEVRRGRAGLTCRCSWAGAAGSPRPTTSRRPWRSVPGGSPSPRGGERRRWRERAYVAARARSEWARTQLDSVARAR